MQHAGAGFVVEDTILKIDGKEVVDIKWNQEDKLKNAKSAIWIVSLGYNDGETIRVYQAMIHGIIVQPKCEGFGFDPYFLPEGSDLTLAELDREFRKDHYSARVRALMYFKNNNFIFMKNINEIEEWKGEYQCST